jgi:hypothetical protein
VLALGALASSWWWLRGRRKRAGRRPGAPRVAARPYDDPTCPPTPRERTIAWSEAVRAALVERFGAAWRAKTSEEIATESDLAALLGPESSAQLIRLLGQADHAKFAAWDGSRSVDRLPQSSSPDADFDDWGPLVTEWVARFQGEVGARSRIEGLSRPMTASSARAG